MKRPSDAVRVERRIEVLYIGGQQKTEFIGTAAISRSAISMNSYMRRPLRRRPACPRSTCPPGRGSCRHNLVLIVKEDADNCLPVARDMQCNIGMQFRLDDTEGFIREFSLGEMNLDVLVDRRLEEYFFFVCVV